MISLIEMLEELDRDIKTKMVMHPKWIAEKRITKEKADRRIEVMEAIRERIKTLWHLEQISLEMRGDFE